MCSGNNSVEYFTLVQIVIEKEENSEHRLFFNCSPTACLCTKLDTYFSPKIDTVINKLEQYVIFQHLILKVLTAKHDWSFPAFEACVKFWKFKRIWYVVINGVPTFQRQMSKLIEEILNDTYPFLDNLHTKPDAASLKCEKIMCCIAQKVFEVDKQQNNIASATYSLKL